jgi:hypothetical protein
MKAACPLDVSRTAPAFSAGKSSRKRCSASSLLEMLAYLLPPVKCTAATARAIPTATIATSTGRLIGRILLPPGIPSSVTEHGKA